MDDLDAVAETIDELVLPYTVIRTARRISLQGVLNPPVRTMEPILAVIHPAGGEELRLPNGNYANDGVIVHSRFRFQLSSEDGSQDADRVNFRGRIYAATTCSDWSEVAGFFKTTALLEPF